MDILESILRWLVAAAVGLVLGTLICGVVRSHGRPGGRTTGKAERVLTGPIEALIGIGFFGVCVVLWRPLPLEPREALRVGVVVAGALLAFVGLGLVMWGRLTLGRLYGVSSTAGAKLHADHRLLTHGPFAYVRHPMYVGIQAAAVGGLLLYRTWTTVFVTVAFTALFLRARREDEALRLEFGDEWEAYQQRVPGWLPRFERKSRRHQTE